MGGSPHDGRTTRPSRPTSRCSTRSATCASSPPAPSGSASARRCSTSGCGTRSSPPAPSPRSTCCRAAGSTSASAPAGWRRSGRPSASTSPAAVGGSTRPSTCAADCGPSTVDRAPRRVLRLRPGHVRAEAGAAARPALHIGGDGPAALRRAATVGDGWVPMNHTLDQIPAASPGSPSCASGPGATAPSRSRSAAASRPTTTSPPHEAAGVHRVFVPAVAADLGGHRHDPRLRGSVHRADRVRGDRRGDRLIVAPSISLSVAAMRSWRSAPSLDCA